MKNQRFYCWKVGKWTILFQILGEKVFKFTKFHTSLNGGGENGAVKMFYVQEHREHMPILCSLSKIRTYLWIYELKSLLKITKRVLYKYFYVNRCVKFYWVWKFAAEKFYYYSKTDGTEVWSRQIEVCIFMP